MKPKLRFPGFVDEWQVKTLSSVSDIITGNTPSTSDRSLYGDEYLFVSPGDMNSGRYVIDTKQRLSKKGFDKSRRVPAKSTLFVCIGSTIGKLAQTTKESTTNQQINAVIPYPEYNQDFVYLSLERLSSRIALLAGEQAVPIISKGEFQKTKITLPVKEEQQKIADFLTAVDDKILALEQKVELLEKYKKGVMQKIFSQKVRFKDEDGKDYPGWQSRKLAEVYTFIRTNSASREALYDGDGVKNIHYGDIHTMLPFRLDTSLVKLPAFKQKGLVFPFPDYCQPGDIVMADASEDYKDVGKCIEVINVKEREVVAGLHTMLLRPITPLVLGFGVYLFGSNNVRKQLKRLATGASVLGLSKDNVSRINLLMPREEEQQKIADFLSSLDDKIGLEKKRLHQAKQFKKILLQRMFV